MNITQKLGEIHAIIDEIKLENPVVADVLIDGFGIALNTLKEIADKEEGIPLDLSERIEVVTRILGFDLEELITYHLQQYAQQQEVSTKEADAATLDFITSTSDMDDYERFLAQNKAKESLDFLSKEI